MPTAPVFNPLTGLMETPGISNFVSGDVVPSEFGLLLIQVPNAAAALTLLGTGSGSVLSVGATVAAGSAAALSVAGSPVTTTGSFTFTVDAALVSIAGLVTAANKMIYTTASDTYATTDLTAFARTLLDDAAAVNARSTLGLVIGTDVQAFSSELTWFVNNTSQAGANITFAGSVTATGFIGGSLETNGADADLGGGDLVNVGAADFVSISTPTFSCTTATVSGTITAGTFSGSGSGLTNLNATNLSGGTVDNARLDADLQALAGTSSTGLWTRTGAGTGSARTITGTSNKITVTDGDGVAGNPTLTIATGYVGQTSITTLGTITTGQWNGTAIPILYGGTGTTSSTLARLNLGIATKYKSGDTSRSGTTSATADPDLAYTISATDVVEFNLWVIVTSASATPDIKFGMTFPTSFSAVAWSADYGDYDANTLEALVFAQDGSTTAIAQIPAGLYGVIKIQGTIANGANAGNISFVWAQSVSDATPTTVKGMSKMVVRKIVG